MNTRFGWMLSAALLASPAAHAVLGGDIASVLDDRARVKGIRLEAATAPLQVRTHSITLSDGSIIREFVSPAGVVFAVTWSTRLKPDLSALLGAHAATYAAATRDAMQTVPGIRRQFALRRGDLVVQSVGHLNSFVGKAYLRSLVPSGVDVDALH